MTCTRCDVHDAAIGFQYGGYTVIDSYIHDLYGYADSHNEAIRELWPHLVRHLGRTRARWAWLLDLEDPGWPPRETCLE